jgi:hypothetical protein
MGDFGRMAAVEVSHGSFMGSWKENPWLVGAERIVSVRNRRLFMVMVGV